MLQDKIKIYNKYISFVKDTNKIEVNSPLSLITKIFRKIVREIDSIIYMIYFMLNKEKIPYGNLHHFENRLTIITTPCSGKSTFSEFLNNHLHGSATISPRKYRGINVISEDRLFLGGTIPQEPWCIIKNLNIVKNIDALIPKSSTLVVLLPKTRLLRNYLKRKRKGVYEWSILRNIIKCRRDVLKFAMENNIPIYRSFELALNDMYIYIKSPLNK